MTKISEIDRVIGSRVRKQRELNGLDVTALADAIGVTESRLVEFENGVQRVDARAMLGLCKTLQVNASYFFATLTERQPVIDDLPVAAE